MLNTSRNWRVVGTSVTGTRHLREERECEDAFAYVSLSEHIFLLAVADGAGTASRSKEGAECAVHAATSAVASIIGAESSDEVFCRTVLERGLLAAREALETLAGSAPGGEREAIDEAFPRQSLSAFATTLILVLVTSTWLAALQVGDGAVVVQLVKGTVETITKPDFKEYINECSFITDSDYQEHVQYAIRPLGEVCGIALLTDGIQMISLELATNTPYAPFFVPLFSFIAQAKLNESELAAELYKFLASPRVCEQTDDDKTLVLAVSLSN